MHIVNVYREEATSRYNPFVVKRLLQMGKETLIFKSSHNSLDIEVGTPEGRDFCYAIPTFPPSDCIILQITGEMMKNCVWMPIM